MPEFSYALPYPSQRQPMLARNVVTTSQPLAAQAGLRMLVAGGNAVDAAIASAIALTVVEPTSNGIGSDAFAIVWDGKRLHGLNASGRSPAAWSDDRFAGRDAMPLRGWDAVTVPGAVSAWVELSARFGKLPFPKLFEPAIEYARDGFLVSPITAAAWKRSVEIFAGEEFGAFRMTFAPTGQGPEPGEVFRSEDHARSLESIAASRGESFYRGELAQRIVRHAHESGGAMSLEDLASHRADEVEPISTRWEDVHLHEIPPNGQGIAALIALSILRHFDLRAMSVDSIDATHVQIEAMKLALADAYAYVADPEHMRMSVEALLDEDRVKQLARSIDMNIAKPQAAVGGAGGTVNLATADASGMMVSFIQSNYYGFGSGVVIPGTGIAMQNRGHGFVTTPADHPNRVGPCKRPFHTIIPGFVTDASSGQPLMSFGLMGGHMQAQGHVQMMTRIFTFGQNPQAASDAPRWRVDGGLEVSIERDRFDSGALQKLAQRGHKLRLAAPGEFGGAQLIYRLEDGYLAASDHRKDGQAVGY